jgi:hypothetical protein
LHFEKEAWLFRLAYLAGIFYELNYLNLNVQDDGNNIFSMEKVRAFHTKLFVWQGQVSPEIFRHFPQCWISLKKVTGKSRRLELNPILRNTRRICHGSSCHIIRSCQKTEMV